MKGTEVAVALAALMLTACTGRALRPDVARVRSLAKVEVLPPVERDDVETEVSRDVQGLLREPLTREGAVRIALLNNRNLRAALRELGVSRGRLMQAGLVANPTFEVEALPERDSDLELRVEYDVSSLLLAPLRQKAAGAELEAARLGAAGEVVRLGYEVRSGYVDLQAAEQSLAIAQRTLDALAAGRDAAEALLAAGNVPALEASRQIVAYERARIEVAKRELTLADAREHMQRLLGLYGEHTSFRIEPALAELPDAPRDDRDLEARVLEASLDMQAIARRLEATGRRTGIARVSGYLPTVEVDAHALRLKPDHDHNQTGWRYGGGVAVEVPLFDRNQGTLRTAEAEFDVLRERQQALAIELRSRAREARNRLVSTHARARTYQSTLVPAQRNVVRQSVLQYNAMQLSVFELLSARRAELEIELAHVAAKRDYFKAEAALDAALAGKLVGASRGADEGEGAMADGADGEEH
ncbi:MAG: TolC family protein [Polyangiales bacterium]